MSDKPVVRRHLFVVGALLSLQGNDQGPPVEFCLNLSIPCVLRTQSYRAGGLRMLVNVLHFLLLYGTVTRIIKKQRKRF